MQRLQRRHRKSGLSPEVSAYRQGELCLLELPPPRTMLEDVNGLGLPVVNCYADLDPAWRPGWARMRTPSSASRRSGGQVQVLHRDPRAAQIR
jgi:hypothetical protein